MRQARDTAMAILHLVVAVLYLPWLAAHLLVIFAASQLSSLGGGVPALGLSLGLHGAGAVSLVVAAVALLRGRPSGRLWSLAYAVLATGGALLLWLTGARAWFVTLLLLYPVTVLYLFLRPPEPPPREPPPAPAPGESPLGPSTGG